MKEGEAEKRKNVVVKGLKENRKDVRNAVEEVFRKIRADVRIEKAW